MVRPFKILDAATIKARNEIMAIEDANIFAAIDAIVNENSYYICA